MSGFSLNDVPYARFLNLTSHRSGDELTVTMPFAEHLIGNPMLPALHGGATAALLELTATAQVALRFPSEQFPRPINVTVAYLRSGKPLAVHARAHIHRAGRRVASVEVQAWQEERAHPIATLHAHFLLNT